ncbi:Olfactory receptor 2T12 [Heterocephalus glaber]|uniref:Olfactory receptor 2T12 n=1 Tax=Heterocephalus glaber TaxID=10181 RepID=G5ANF4_HETGA|nr:Olfactory receptor 2T12 [Heterocephalus glaber]
MDLVLISTIVPKMTAAYLTGNKFISPVGCGLQIFFFQTTGGTEGFLLGAMSYDHYVAVCHLLQHNIDHFFCEAPTLVHLACSDTSAFEYAMYICCMLMLLIPLSLILMSYSLILTAVLHMRSTEARKKVFATCSSHLAVVGLYYGGVIFIYMRPTSYRSAKHDKVVSAFYIIFAPMLHPVIYSLRINEVKEALRKCQSNCAALRSD